MKCFCTLVLLATSSWSIPFVQAQDSPLGHAELQDASVAEVHRHDMSFEQVRLPGGYVSNFINGVAQDPQGFLWLATRAWLIRYDGYETTTFRPNAQDSTSLASSKWVEAVHIDREGTLWVGTFGGGLDRFNSETETFTHFPHDPDTPTSLSGDTVTVMMEDRDGTFWVGTHQGLNRMDREMGTFTRFRHDPQDPTSLSNDQVRTIYEDREGVLWIGTGSPWGSESPSEGGGLNRLDRESGTFTRYVNDPEDDASLIDNHVTALFEDAGGTFWVGTAGDGLHSMDRQRGTFTRHLYDPAAPNTLSMPHVDAASGPAYVTVVREDRSDQLWIGAINGGLNRYNRLTGERTDHKSGPGRLRTILVNDLFESREGTLWVVTWDGLFKVVPDANAIRHHTVHASEDAGVNSVKAFLEDREGALWIGTEGGGLIRFGRNDDEQPASAGLESDARYLNDPGDPLSLSDNSVLSLHDGSDGSIWVGTAAGLDRLDLESGRFSRYQHDPGDPHSLGAGQVFSINEDRRGELWVGIYGGGLSRLDRSEDRFERYPHDPNDPNSLSDNDVVAVHEDQDGIFWIGTSRGGLNRFDPEAEKFTHFPHPVADASGLTDGFLTSIYEDDAGMLWIGTMLGGLNQFDPTTGRFTHFTSANSGLPDNRIQGILADADGNLWLSTGNGPDSGLSRFALKQKQFYTYDTDLILPAGNAPPGSFKRRNGDFLFGGDNGFVAFSPEEAVAMAVQNAHPPQPVLTGLTLLNQPVLTGSDEPARESLIGRREIRLRHDENAFSLDFVGLHFKDSAKNRYTYMLEGYDDTWRAAGLDRQAAYYKVPPGAYVFRVEAANSDGIWTEEGAAMPILIRPPWWRTWWAYLAYGMFFIGGVFTVDRLQRRRVLEAERRRATMREIRLRADLAEGQTKYLETLDRAKSRFFANVSHEFRTPLTLLLGPIRDLIEGRIDAERLAGFAPLMHRNAGRLLELINQLLDLSRLDAGGVRLDAQYQDVVPFLRRHVLTFTSRVERDGVALVFTAVPEVIEMTFDADKLEKIISNLLSNAFKFTPSGGRIRVMVERDGDDIEISVRDTGEGMADDDLPLVFDRFYQVDASSTRRHMGTGIGLSLAKELVELHGGTIAVESERGFGSIFTVRLPLKRDGDEGIDTLDRPNGIREEKATDGFHEPPIQPSQQAVTQDAVDALANTPRILIVEDNADMRGYLGSQLSDVYRILEAEDGVEGLRMAKEHRPDLVISDVMMPEMDGFTLCESIKSNKELEHIPVILLTARADEGSRIEGLQTGADDYLAKPFSLDELMTRVENLVEIRRRLREHFSESVRLGPEEIVVTSADAAFVERVRDAIEIEMADREFGVSRLAAALCMSERQLHRRIKEAAGLTPAAYIRMMRLERAAQLLEQRAGRVSDVAYAVGFNNAKYFSRLYRQTFGHAPSEDVDADGN